MNPYSATSQKTAFEINTVPKIIDATTSIPLRHTTEQIMEEKKEKIRGREG
jgi:hypothetical protein